LHARTNRAEFGRLFSIAHCPIAYYGKSGKNQRPGFTRYKKELTPHFSRTN
jgi:hypothetical protein